MHPGSRKASVRPFRNVVEDEQIQVKLWRDLPQFGADEIGVGQGQAQDAIRPLEAQASEASRHVDGVETLADQRRYDHLGLCRPKKQRIQPFEWNELNAVSAQIQEDFALSIPEKADGKDHAAARCGSLWEGVGESKSWATARLGRNSRLESFSQRLSRNVAAPSEPARQRASLGSERFRTVDNVL